MAQIHRTLLLGWEDRARVGGKELTNTLGQRREARSGTQGDLTASGRCEIGPELWLSHQW